MGLSFLIDRPQMRIVSFKEVRSRHRECATLGEMFNHVVVEPINQEWCWDPNCLIGHLFPKEDSISYQNLLTQCKAGKFLPQELIKFCMQRGLTLDCFHVYFDPVKASDFSYITDAAPGESILAYVVRTFAGKELYI